MKRPLTTGAVCLATTLLLSGWTYADAKDDLCDSMSELRKDSTALSDLDTYSSKSDARDAYDDVQDDWEDVRDDLGELDGNARESLEKAADDLRKAYDDLPDGASVREIISALRPEAQRLGQELRDAASDLKCS
ncbi:hypothetical protein [Streptomyces boninensis]|uniref:hypothetical protein n=1 Tax=Streptomyces boninensis TaxID=2039455 RepID=UPI003B2229F4